MQRNLAKLEEWIDPMMPLPPPEPPPVQDIGFLWEVEPWWYYTVLEPSDEPIDDPTDDYEEVKVRSD